MKEIVIKMPDEMYDWFINGFPDKTDMDELQRLVIEGTVLPKGHGRLIDAAVLRQKMGNLIGFDLLGRCIDEELTIIKADGGNK